MAYKKFKLVYGAKNKDIKGSLSGIPAEKDPTIVTLDNYNAKLVYEKDNKLLASLTGIPAEGDRVIGTRKELEGVDPEAAKVVPAKPAEEAKTEASAETKEEPAAQPEAKKAAKK